MPYINVNFNRQRLCESRKLPSVFCNSLMGNGVKQHGLNVSNHSNLNTIGQRMDAVIYSMIVAVFYAGIILIILLSNSHRFRTNKKRRNSKNKNKLSTNGLTRTKTRDKFSAPIGKEIIVHNNREMTVVDISDKYPDTII